MRTPFDWNTATVEQRQEEVRRRNRNRAAGGSPTDDGEGDTIHPSVVLVNGKNPREVPTGFQLPVSIVRVRLAWSMLCPDNERFRPALRRWRGQPRAVLVMSKQYRAAKQQATASLATQLKYGDARPFTAPVRVEAHLYEPDRRTRRDVGNYIKAVHDCLTDAGILEDDSLIDELRWVRAGVDVDAPRLELTVEVLA